MDPAEDRSENGGVLMHTGADRQGAQVKRREERNVYGFSLRLRHGCLHFLFAESEARERPFLNGPFFVER